MKGQNFVLIFVFAIASITSFAQADSVRVKLTGFSYNLSMYNDDKLINSSLFKSDISFDAPTATYTVTVDPKGLCQSCKESSASAKLIFDFSTQNKLHEMVTNPALNVAQITKAVFPIFLRDNKISFIDVYQGHNAQTVTFSSTILLKDNYLFELRLYHAVFTNSYITYSEIPSSRIKIIVQYTTQPEFSAPKKTK